MRSVELVLVVYLLLIGLGAAVLVIGNFPSQDAQGLVFPHQPNDGGSSARDAEPRQPGTSPPGNGGSSAGGSEAGMQAVKLWPWSSIRLASDEQALLALTFLAGIAGSFIHSAQSLASYLGNRSFKASWRVWYFLRPWIGGVLAMGIYFVVRAGLISGGNVVNPYGLVALGFLGGWFSKTTTDKLQEVFDTLFRTHQDSARKDKLDSDTQEDSPSGR